MRVEDDGDDRRAACSGAGCWSRSSTRIFLHADSAALVRRRGCVAASSGVAAVHHAEMVAVKVGEPMGSILLALAVTVIEVALIVVRHDGVGDRQQFARARHRVLGGAIVLNGVVGLCLLVGGARYREQGFRDHGTGSALSVLATLAMLTLVLPNFTVARLGPQYSTMRLIFIGGLSLMLYGVFIFVQSIRHREYFLVDPDGDEGDAHAPPSAGATALGAPRSWCRSRPSCCSRRSMSPAMKRAVESAGLPGSSSA